MLTCKHYSLHPQFISVNNGIHNISTAEDIFSFLILLGKKALIKTSSHTVSMALKMQQNLTGMKKKTMLGIIFFNSKIQMIFSQKKIYNTIHHIRTTRNKAQ